jgi:transposase-like protein
MFKNLHELIISMPTEAACRSYLASQRWPDGKIACPHCGQEDKVYVIDGGAKYKCASPICYKKFSVTVGTVFHASNVPLVKWFTAVYLVSNHKKGISSHQLARDLGVSQKTSWFMIHRIREALRIDYPELLAGVVEVDETYVGGKMKNKHNKVREKYKKDGGYLSGHAGNKVGVMGLVSRGNNVQARVMNSAKQTMKEMVISHVHPSATIMTDSLVAYRGLANTFADHKVIHHEKSEFAIGDVYTNTIEGFFSQLKRGIYGIYHSVSHKHLQRYCDEFAFRYNSRTIKDYERFNLTLRNLEGRLTYNQLVYNADKKPTKEAQ